MSNSDVSRIEQDTQYGMAEALRAGQNKLLELIARGAPLNETLTKLALLIESQHEGLFCSVLLLDKDGVTIHPAAGPNLPAHYMGALDGYSIGPAVGSCGTAMYRKSIVIVSDIENDPLWAQYKTLVVPHGLRACWSSPIFLDQNTVLGSFAMYYREVRSPTPADMVLIEVAVHIAGIAIERTRSQEELQRHRDHLEDLVRSRTAELATAKEHAEASLAELAKSNLTLANTVHNLSITQEELVRSKKLAALGSLVAGIAHELNTPIGNGLMAASTLADQTASLSERYAQVGHSLKRSELELFMNDARDASDLMMRNLNRAANLITSFKQVAVDQTSSSRRKFLLDELVAEIVLALMPTIRKTAIIVEQKISPGIMFDSYPGPLGQVLTNLLQNCFLHAFDEGDAGLISIVAYPQGDQSYEIIISDDGIGIPVAHLERIYDPFFTTKLGVGGCGLGLNIVHSIVIGILAGQIRCNSSLNVGTSFILTLPVVTPLVQVTSKVKTLPS